MGALLYGCLTAGVRGRRGWWERSEFCTRDHDTSLAKPTSLNWIEKNELCPVPIQTKATKCCWLLGCWPPNLLAGNLFAPFGMKLGITALGALAAYRPSTDRGRCER